MTDSIAPLLQLYRRFCLLAGTPATRQEGDLCNQCATEDKLFYLNDRLLTERRRLSAQQKVIQEIESEIASLKTTNPQ